MRKRIKTLCLLGASLGISGFPSSAFAGDHIRWTEDVKLSDGKIIQIQRHVELTSSGFPVQRRGFDKYQEICYAPLKLHWKSRGGYQPDIFDIVDGKAYMHVPVASQYECDQQGNPFPNALYFVWENNHWKRIRHEEFPSSAEWNLLMQTKRGSPSTDPQGHITTQDKSTGNWNDWTIRAEQKRFGWKRINESYYYREGCTQWGKTSTELKPDAVSIFINDGKNTCQR
jgi:hypothetical protein